MVLGSFDLVGNEFSKADWNNYAAELDAMLKAVGKRCMMKCAGRLSMCVKYWEKILYLSCAYWIFPDRAFVSIISFLIQLYQA